MRKNCIFLPRGRCGEAAYAQLHILLCERTIIYTRGRSTLAHIVGCGSSLFPSRFQASAPSVASSSLCSSLSCPMGHRAAAVSPRHGKLSGVRRFAMSSPTKVLKYLQCHTTRAELACKMPPPDYFPNISCFCNHLCRRREAVLPSKSMNQYSSRLLRRRTGCPRWGACFGGGGLICGSDCIG